MGHGASINRYTVAPSCWCVHVCVLLFTCSVEVIEAIDEDAGSTLGPSILLPRGAIPFHISLRPFPNDPSPLSHSFPMAPNSALLFPL